MVQALLVSSFVQDISNLSISYRQVLARVLKYCQVTLDCLKEAGVVVTLQRRAELEAAHYCSMCEVNIRLNWHILAFFRYKYMHI